MVENSQEQTKNHNQQELERHVKEMMGPSAREIDKQQSSPLAAGDSATEINTTGIQSEQSDLPGAPPVGSTISPTRSPESTSQSQSDLAHKNNNQLPGLSPVDQASKTTRSSKLSRLKRFFRVWWGNPKTRWATIAGAMLLLFAIILTPTSRYFLLNSLGVRASASVTVLDNSTQLPLRNVQVNIANATALTDGNGQVKLEHLKLGSAKLVIQKRAFATFNKTVTVGWGSNPLGNFQITPVGAQYSFIVKDWLSGQPIAKAEATSGDADAFSDNNGKILLTIDPSEITDNMTVTIKAGNYRNETVQLDTASKSDQLVNMVISRKEVFISNRSGKYDLYTVDIDGKNEKLVLPGTGLERDDIVLVPHPTDEVTALVSSRVNARDADGFLLSTLTLINLQDNSTLEVAQSEQIQIVGWAQNRLIFVQIEAGASASDPSRFRLISYDYKTTDRTEIARSNYFNDVLMIGNKVYYAPSSAYQTDPATGLFVANADGTNKQRLLNNEVWNIFRVSYDTLDLSVGGDWYEYKLGDSNAVKLDEAPANPKTWIYLNNSENTDSLWVDQRDGKGVLLDYNLQAASDKILKTQNGLNYPVRWLNSRDFIYRVNSDQETADYVMSLDGGTAHKITDVYNTAGIDRWYFY